MSKKCRELVKNSSNSEGLFINSTKSEAFCGFDKSGIEIPNISTLKSSKNIKTAECNSSQITKVRNYSNEKSHSAVFDENEILNDIPKEECDYYNIFKEAYQVKKLPLKCTTCSCQLFLDNPKNIEIHPALGVLLCKNCKEFYSKGPFTKDENGQDEYCRWCAENEIGTLVSCDTCSNVFCKACLRRCLGRVSLLHVIGNACKWSCLVCNNVPLWAQRAQCRMAISAINFERSMIDSTDPAIWLPEIIEKAKKLATSSKILATKVEDNWSQEIYKGNCSISRDEESDKRKVIRCCRKLRKGIIDTRLNLKLLEKKIVEKFAAKYDNIEDIYVDQHSEVSNPMKTSKTHADQILIGKNRNLTEANSKQDYCASSCSSSNISLPDSVELFSSLETPPHVHNLSDESYDLSDVSTEVESYLAKSKETQLSVTDITDECNDFFNAVSEMMDRKPKKAYSLQDSLLVRSEYKLDLKASAFPVEQNPNICTSTPEIYSSHLDCPIMAAQNLNPSNDEVNDENFNNSIVKPKLSLSPAKSENSVDFPGKSTAGHAMSTTTGRKFDLSKLVRITPSSLEDLTTYLSSSEEEAVIDSYLQTVSSTISHSNSIEFDEPSTSNLNEEARQKLLLESSSDTEYSFDSDFNLNETVTSSAKEEIQRSCKPKEDDPKLKAQCLVIVELINSRNCASTFNNLTVKPMNIATKSMRIKSDDFESESEFYEIRKNGGKRKKRPMSREEAAVKRCWLSDLKSSSSSDSECESSLEVIDITKSAPTLSLHFNEAARQALLATSDSDSSIIGNSVSEIETSTEKNSSDENFDDVQTKDDGIDKIQVVDLTSDEEKAVETCNAKTDKLLRMDLDDPEVAKKRGNEKKKSRKKKRPSGSCSDSKSQSSESEVEKRKRKKKRLHPSDSKDSGDGDDDSEDSTTTSKSRRKTSTNNSDNFVDSDTGILNESQRSEGCGSKGRKNIKKIMKDTSLKDETKAAAKEEEERKKRIAERQKLYNEVLVGDMDIVNVHTESLILDFDPCTKEELVTVNKNIVSKLKLHQVQGVKFMWDACFESLEMLKRDHGSGCILAHCMGLGKSLQVVTLAHTVLVNKACQVDRVLVICPVNTILNWVNEFKVWLAASSDVDVYELVTTRNNTKEQKMQKLRKWLEGGGVFIIGYPMFRILTNENKIVKTQEDRELVTKALVNPGPQLVVCDEGHFLKNEKTALYLAINKITTRRRIVLTGTPLQNNLEEYFCMVQFVKPNLLGTIAEFKNRFANPIKNGQTADAETHDVKLMKRQAHVLHRLLENSVQRCDYGVLTPFLPPKHEYVISVKLSDIQIKMYQYYLEHHARKRGGQTAGLFVDFQELGRVWTHPKALVWSALNRKTKQKNHNESKTFSSTDVIDDQVGTELAVSEDDGTLCTEENGDGKEPVGAGTSNKSTINADQEDKRTPEKESPVASTPLPWWSQFSEEDMTVIEHSGKLVLLMDILNQCELIGDKVLVFSQSLASLNLIEEFLALENKRNEKNRADPTRANDTVVTWQINHDYFRFDGSTTPEARTNSCNSFNNSSNLRSRLFLISTKAGGIGINLVAANRVVIFDASWNPSHDVQSIFRVYRFGQTKPCYVYRFLAQGTMEEKIYDRQVTKLSLACRVVDEQQIERHFNSSDLNELYLFEPDSHLRRPTPLVPKDRLLAELIIKHKNWIVTYHEHDSLLVNKSEEELPEAERKAAWEDFQHGLLQKEKRRANSLMMNASLSLENIPGSQEIATGLVGEVVGIPLTAIAAMIHNSNTEISESELLGRLRMTVDNLQDFSIQQAPTAATIASVASTNSTQQP